MRKCLQFLTVATLIVTGCSKAPKEEGVVDTTLAGATEATQSVPAEAPNVPQEEIDDRGGVTSVKGQPASGSEYGGASGTNSEVFETAMIAESEARGAIPRGNPGYWVTSNDYPTRALREERTGTVGFRVEVDESGRVASCEIVLSSGSTDLDEATCANVSRRARFSPAISSDGQPMRGSYSNSIRWTIPE
jgi:TonB family protein